MKIRVISSILMLAIVIPLLIIGGLSWQIAVSIIAIATYMELVSVKGDKLPNFIKFIGSLNLLLILLDFYKTSSLSISYQIIIVGLISLLLPVLIYHNNKVYSPKDALYLVGAIFLLGLAFNSLIYVRNQDITYMIFLILITTMSDMFAYFFGRLIGKHLFAPDISPKKTWEGTILGCLTGTFIASTYYLTVINPAANVLLIVGLVLVLSFMASLGDLIESSIKRYFGIKDFSNLIPGHGGIFDRLDSLIFVVLVYILLVGYF